VEFGPSRKLVITIAAFRFSVSASVLSTPARARRVGGRARSDARA